MTDEWNYKCYTPFHHWLQLFSTTGYLSPLATWPMNENIRSIHRFTTGYISPPLATPFHHWLHPHSLRWNTRPNSSNTFSGISVSREMHEIITHFFWHNNTVNVYKSKWTYKNLKNTRKLKRNIFLLVICLLHEFHKMPVMINLLTFSFSNTNYYSRYCICSTRRQGPINIQSLNMLCMTTILYNLKICILF